MGWQNFTELMNQRQVFWSGYQDMWVCQHPVWLESSRQLSWASGNSGDSPPEGLNMTALEYCQICGQTRERIVSPSC